MDARPHISGPIPTSRDALQHLLAARRAACRDGLAEVVAQLEHAIALLVEEGAAPPGQPAWLPMTAATQATRRTPFGEMLRRAQEERLRLARLPRN